MPIRIKQFSKNNKINKQNIKKNKTNKKTKKQKNNKKKQQKQKEQKESKNFNMYEIWFLVHICPKTKKRIQMKCNRKFYETPDFKSEKSKTQILIKIVER